jgi:adenosylhomocysteinase
VEYKVHQTICRRAFMDRHVKDLSLAERGELRIQWAEREMPVLRRVRERFSKDRPLEGITVGACLHVTTETANLMLALRDGGAQLALCASNPLSTQDDVAAALVVKHDIPVFAVKGEDKDTYYSHIAFVLATRPRVTLDDGADLISTLHFLAQDREGELSFSLSQVFGEWAREERKDLVERVIGSTEETTTGVIRLKSLADQKKLLFPVVAVNDADTKHLFDNRYGTGQSTIDGILRATNRLIAGSIFVVCGYGWCGRGVAMRARGMGARVVVTEVDPIKALEAVMDGFMVMPLAEAARTGDFFVTVTGDIAVIRKEHFEVMKDGAMVANAGHFNVEIDLGALEAITLSKKRMRPFVDEYTLKDGRRIVVLGEGRLVNLVAAEGHPSAVMDMSFADQALAVEYLVKEGRDLEPQVYRLPRPLDEEVAEIKLESMGISIDKLTPQQEKYLSGWEMGT